MPLIIGTLYGVLSTVNSEMKANHAESLTLSMHSLTQLHENARETVKNNMGIAPA